MTHLSHSFEVRSPGTAWHSWFLALGFTGLSWRCWQGCFPYGGSGDETFPGSFRLAESVPCGCGIQDPHFLTDSWLGIVLNFWRLAAFLWWWPPSSIFKAKQSVKSQRVESSSLRSLWLPAPLLPHLPSNTLGMEKVILVITQITWTCYLSLFTCVPLNTCKVFLEVPQRACHMCSWNEYWLFNLLLLLFMWLHWVHLMIQDYLSSLRSAD